MFARNLTLKLLFGNDVTDSVQLFKRKSDFVPHLPSNVELFVKAVEKTLYTESTSAHGGCLDNLTTMERQALKGLKTNNDIIIRPADKGGLIVVMDRSYYLETMKSMLLSDAYAEITIDTVTQMHDMVNRTLVECKGCGLLSEDLFSYFMVEYPLVPCMYGLPKVHKNRWLPPFRPIVSGAGWITEPISVYLDTMFKKVLCQYDYVLHDTQHFLTGLYEFFENANIKDNYILTTLDVESLFTCIQNEIGIKMVRDLLLSNGSMDIYKLLHYIRNVIFKTSDGDEVLFDINGDTPAIYDILNWQASPNGTVSKYVHVGHFDSRAPSGQDIFINESLILWHGGSSKIPRSVCSESCPTGTRKAVRRGEPACCFDCIPCSKGEISNQTDASNCFRCSEMQWPNEVQNTCVQKRHDFLSYEEALGAGLTGSTVVLSIITASTLCTFVMYRNTPIVKANNRELSYVILFVLFLCFLCPLIFIGKPTELTCLLRQTGFGMLFSLCVSGILAKTIIVVIAFKATNPNSNLRSYMGHRTPCCIVSFGTLLQVTLCIIWLTVTPPFPEMNMKLEEGKIILQCKEGSEIMFYCILGYLGLLASVSFVVAFLARALPDSFNEAKFISFSMIVFVSVWLTFIPAYISTTGKYMVAVEIFAIVASDAGILFCIFFPKCYIILVRPELNTRGQLLSNVNTSKKK
ncbi:vomeronasal type-2 receptor 26-like [Protopterus annectens]|uniref:vomeronasal type-2 receptor 26-like n=1 Tax=Protopterus annectens TaxID=7888 RepID=UPI001CF9B016|nr:vomeronasal type-2 receptor 26-like [Protopterus annectens]